MRLGALVLLRDVSELRRRERELMTKDATIREIHHRVKNNLQTVAALLRLQARRLPPDAEGRGALEEAVRRVGAIALVHQTLSQGLDETVAFDDIAAQSADHDDRGRPARRAGARHPRTGSFGLLRAEDATPLALVLTELLTNAVEHGLRGGQGGSRSRPSGSMGDDGRDTLLVQVGDDGTGMPAGASTRRRPGSAPRSCRRWSASCAGRSPGRRARAAARSSPSSCTRARSARP